MTKTNKQMFNRHIILYVVVITLFLIGPVNAENMVVNGDFETGNFDGWSDIHSETGVSTDSKFSGTYGDKTVIIQGANQGDTSDTLMYQDVDLTGISNLTFLAKCHKYDNTGMGFSKLLFKIGGVTKYDSGYGLFAWDKITINVSGYSGINRILFYGYVFSGNGDVDAIYYIDDVEALIDEPAVSEISFYPVLTNETPTYVNFSIVELDEDSEYGLFIYRNVSNVSSYIDYVGWFYDEVGSVSIDIVDYGANCTYYAKLWGVHVGDITTCEQEYIFNDSIDPFPTPGPTPDITPLPTFTPPPTPVPPDNPVSNNSLNNTWVAGYFSLVDSVMNGLFHPVFNFTGYLMHPMTIIMGGGIDFMDESTYVFDDVEDKILIATGLMGIFFDSLPDKVVFVLLYNMVWIVILIIMKGAT